MAEAIEAVRTAVYRAYGADGALLYVGLTGSPESRFRQHSMTKPQWHEVCRIDLVWYPSRREAAAAEMHAIRSEKPRWNTKGRPWQPTEEQAAILARLRRHDAERRAVRAQLSDLLAKCEVAGIPIARLAEEMGTQRKTVYRRLGRPMP